LAVDTSVAVALLVGTHDGHSRAVAWCAGREVALSGHAQAETYSVLTRLPGDLRLTPSEANRVLQARFGEPLLLGARTFRRLPAVLAEHGISGAAVYDALVGLAALEHDSNLATRDLRARDTYAAIGVSVTLVD
jgi:predicted nucleic acid-binding protein